MTKPTQGSSYALATTIVFLLSGSSLFAFSSNSQPDAPLSGLQVIAGFAILLSVMLLPLMKAPRKTRTK